VNRLCSGVMVEAQQPAEPSSASDGPDSRSCNGLASHGKASATDLLFQDSILLAEVLDDRVLLTSDPARHGGDADLPGLEDSGPSSIMPTSRDNRQLSANDETA